MMSVPAETSITCERRALGLSRVTMMGGLGLFLEPGGRPRGRRLEAMELVAPLVGSKSCLGSSSLSESLDSEEGCCC